LLSLEKSMHKIMERKANSPIHAQIGDEKHMPSPSAVTSFGKELETLNNKTEFATDYLVKLNVVDFGDMAGKFADAFKHDEDMLFFSFQIPEVLMGRGNIPEGLAAVQMEAFKKRIASFQADIEKNIEQQIFKRILNAQKIDAHVEFEWGEPSNTETMERIKVITEILKNPALNMGLKIALEEELASLLKSNVVIYGSSFIIGSSTDISLDNFNRNINFKLPDNIDEIKIQPKSFLIKISSQDPSSFGEGQLFHNNVNICRVSLMHAENDDETRLVMYNRWEKEEEVRRIYKIYHRKIQ